MTREYKKWKNRSTNKNEQLLKIQHYIKVRLYENNQIEDLEFDETVILGQMLESLP